MEIIVKFSPELISGARVAAGQSADKIKNSSTEFKSLPSKGTFESIGVMVYTKDQNGNIDSKVKPFLCQLAKVDDKVELIFDDKIHEKSDNYLYSLGLVSGNNFISENSMNSQRLFKELVEIKSGKSANSNTLKSERTTKFPASLGASMDARIASLVGKRFTTTELPDSRVWKGSALKNYHEKCVGNDVDTLWTQTEAKKLYSFSFPEIE